MENLSTFQREYLWELEIPARQIIELAESVPEEAYDWRPAEDARTFAAVLVHIAAGNLMLLYGADVRSPAVMKFRGSQAAEEGPEQWLMLVRQSVAMQKTITSKDDVLDLLRTSFEAVKTAVRSMKPEEMEATCQLWSEVTTYRRIYLRILAHADEHMGQAIGYARVMGFRVPWPDPVRMMEEMAAQSAARSAATA
ncbi:DinB family protein [Occallatibacter riparius]|uniref:DinB family protein n=1 Tax=Occallatibacter riparius TaxID=1002689 RepID=A0A9J7BQX3_9BACT|nr:DinB family protein [Occallatibacter riparius]UWZ84969.1 DinB family protein [Occallatibacter riparius]